MKNHGSLAWTQQLHFVSSCFKQMQIDASGVGSRCKTYSWETSLEIPIFQSNKMNSPPLAELGNGVQLPLLDTAATCLQDSDGLLKSDVLSISNLWRVCVWKHPRIDPQNWKTAVEMWWHCGNIFKPGHSYHSWWLYYLGLFSIFARCNVIQHSKHVLTCSPYRFQLDQHQHH